jgi:HEAT repeat protein
MPSTAIVRNLSGHDRALADIVIPIAMRDDNPGVRLAALEVVATGRRWQDVGLLSNALRDTHEAVRATAAYALGQYRSISVA